jgi:hypothetical protein
MITMKLQGHDDSTNVKMSVHESQTVDHYGPEIVRARILAQMDELVNKNGIMDNVVLGNNGFMLHAKTRQFNHKN